MMLPRTRRGPRRLGAAAVEFAFVAPILFMLLLGILEYCRFLMTVQLMNNAAREGARYTVVNTTAALTTASIQTYVDNYMAGQGTAQLVNYTPSSNITVYQADPNTGANVGNWQNAGWGAPIGVTITGTYNPVVPGILYLTGSIPVQATCIMYSEAN
jgi:Flp pilus assembly protein TadG